MRDRRRDCELLRPVLVALVYDEPHLELPRLMAHLEVCDSCRREEDDLRATRAWVDGSADTLATDLLTLGEPVENGRRTGLDARRALLPTLSNVLAGAAVALLAVWLLVAGGEDGNGVKSGVSSPGPLGKGQGETVWTEAALSFDGVEVDRRVDWLEGEVGWLKDSGESPW